MARLRRSCAPDTSPRPRRWRHALIRRTPPRSRAAALKTRKGLSQMAKIYYENSADPALIRAKKVAVFGYGSQGHAHALNLRDSGVEVKIALEAGSRSRPKAEQ